ncbi:MAG: hypothetical protein OXB97_08190 [Rhodospirillales bacterium]|nr:hypothetical protein [Rhodospirillales bacterium]
MGDDNGPQEASSLEPLRVEVRDLKTQLQKALYTQAVLTLIVTELAARTSTNQALADDLRALSQVLGAQEAGAVSIDAVIRRLFDMYASRSFDLKDVKQVVDAFEIMLRNGNFGSGES